MLPSGLLFSGDLDLFPAQVFASGTIHGVQPKYILAAEICDRTHNVGLAATPFAHLTRDIG